MSLGTGNEGNGAAGRRPRLLRGALIVSLTLNLLVAGLVAGAMLNRDRDARPGPAMADIGYGPFIGALPREARRDLAMALVERAGSLRENRETVRAQFAAMLAALRADPFDGPRFQAIVDEQEAKLRERQAIGRELLFAQIARMTPAERRDFADKLERGFRRGPKFGPPRHED